MSNNITTGGRAPAELFRSKPAASWLYRRRLAEVCHLYAPAAAGDRCEYCGGPGEVLDHVPGVALVCRMSDQERADVRPRLVRSCRSCNRVLRECVSVDLAERRAFALLGRAAAQAQPRPLRRARIASRPEPRRPDGRGKSPGSRIRVLVEVGNWRVCLGGFLNTFHLWRRAGVRSPWERIASAPWRPELERQMFIARAPAAFVSAVAGLPEWPRDASNAARRRAAAAALSQVQS